MVTCHRKKVSAQVFSIMKRIILSLLLSVISLFAFSQTITLFDDDWRFFRGGAHGAENPGFDDKNWRIVDLPHDWSIEDIPGKQTPFDPLAIGSTQTGFTIGGTGWYRKWFDIPTTDKDKLHYILFEGVYMNADVWVNGVLLGNHPYGYTSFGYNITPLLKAGERNLIAVKVKNEGENSRWYSGSGIYRHVWMKTWNNIHVAQYGTSISTPVITSDLASVHVESEVQNESGKASKVKLVASVLNSGGIKVATSETERSLEAKNKESFSLDLKLEQPKLWSVESPNLYTMITEVFCEGKLMDRVETKFGIRSISFDVTNGFMLNGTRMKLKGGCVHHDNGPLGAKAYDRAEERRVQLLKASGFNAIRCSHNPPSPAFLDACDKLGMLVMDEAFDMWNIPKNPHDYNLYFEKWWRLDINSMITRDRNHPSIIMWSIGNEIPGMEEPEVAVIAKKLSDYVHQQDPTRPVTAAVNGLNERKDPFFAAQDVAGYNYAVGQNPAGAYVRDHQRVPSRIMVGTESYALGAFQSWMDVVDNPYVIGDFVWTAFDYIGEASIGWRGYWPDQTFYPWSLAYCGDIDICGWKRPQSYYRDVLWNKNELSVFVKSPKPSFEENPRRESWSIWHWDDVVADWTWPGYEGKTMEVVVYSSCDEAELFLNGKSLGKKTTGRQTEFKATWQVPYQAGELKAVGYEKRKKIKSATLQSASDLKQVKLTADKSSIVADGQDLSYVTVELVDDKGQRLPKANQLIRFEISGGAIAGVGNANPVSVESYQQPQRNAWQGRALVIIKSLKNAGPIRLKAMVDGVPPAEITIESR